MQEKLLQFIWQHGLFLPSGLKTTTSEPVTVIQRGIRNAHAGPDFLEARIQVGNTILAGHIEIHVRSSDWHRHGHQHDDAYKNVILHVVLQDDSKGDVLSHTPTLELSGHIMPGVTDMYASLTDSKHPVPCSGSIAAVKDITKEAWLNRLLAERWEEKLTGWKDQLEHLKEDWQSLLYWRLAYNFGFKVNADAFLQLAQSLPLQVLAKHKDNILQLEALLFGQAGMLEGAFADEYSNRLQEEYSFLRAKYRLQPLPLHLWKFMRMRPANFPTIRIAQFAALIHRSVHLFSKIIETTDAKQLMPLFEVTASSYWNSHYRFGDEEDIKATPKHLGKASVANILINTIAPMQYLFAVRQGTSHDTERAVNLLDTLPAERNSILANWNSIGWQYSTAAQSQGLLQLYNGYCSKKRCLECSIGHSVLKAR